MKCVCVCVGGGGLKKPGVKSSLTPTRRGVGGNTFSHTDCWGGGGVTKGFEVVLTRHLRFSHAEGGGGCKQVPSL